MPARRVLLRKEYQMSARLFAATLCGLALVASAAAAEDKPLKTATVMTVGEMCGGCVKKIEKKLKPMEGVAAVRCDIKAKTVTVVPKRDVNIAPLALWSAMEEIGKTPTKMVSPEGTYTKKPKAKG